MQRSGSVRDVAELCRLVRAGVPVKYLFFWGHRPPADGGVGVGCLSQWWPAAFVVDGIRFATAEHYMMWRKAVLFDDTTAAEAILTTVEPAAAKALGARVHGFEEPIWRTHRVDIVVTGNRAKFSQHPDLGAFLAGTGNRVLVEASPLDRIWGIGLTRDDRRATEPAQWPGLNLLGFALMRTRDMITYA